MSLLQSMGRRKSPRSTANGTQRKFDKVSSPLSKSKSAAVKAQGDQNGVDCDRDDSQESEVVEQLQDLSLEPEITEQMPTPPALSRDGAPRKISLSKSSDYISSSSPPSRAVAEIAQEREAVRGLVRPSSPLLSVLREAIDSLSSMDDFETLGLIGSGFFADVYKVCHIPTSEIMVLKVNKRTSNKTLKEVELLKRLSHPNVLHYLGACVLNGQLHPLTEFVNGGTLEELIHDSAHPFPPSLRMQLSLDMGKGMAYLHRNGMLHRDLNSHNCLLRKNANEYTAVVADFGLAARAPNVVKSLTRHQSVVGTPFWMAPEVLNGKLYDEKADVFSYGIVLCEIITRKDADPDYIPRNRDFSLDASKFLEMAELQSSTCSESFIQLALQCSMFNPTDRPDFNTIVHKLMMLLSFGKDEVFRSTENTAGIPPTPTKRLSWHCGSSPSSSHSTSPVHTPTQDSNFLLPIATQQFASTKS